MSKIIPSNLSPEKTNKMLKLFYKKINSINTESQTKNFLSDILTESEQIMIIRRLQIAKMLLEGKTYFEIKKELNVGVDTIKSVRYKIGYGNGGYIYFIKNLKY